eukprot:GHRR01007444.1.p1 GENE.GHRR01007444.1~~GHRR01007444.1.p1  ORF type:complete len:921 (+),score=350.13 GHRR01007444.1:614-3376(+)
MSFAFKKFSFFQQLEVPVHDFPPNSTSHCLGGNFLYVGCDNGTVQLLDDVFQFQGCYNAYGYKVLYMAWVQARQLLVTVGLEEPGISSATIKLWDTERVATAATAVTNGAVSAAGSSPPASGVSATLAANVPPFRIQKVFNSKYPESEVTALAVTDRAGSSSGILIAVGLAAGSVYLFNGEAASQKGKLHHTGRLSARPDAGELWKVNALAFTQQRSKQSSAPERTQQSPVGAPGTAPAVSTTSSKLAALTGRATAAATGSAAASEAAAGVPSAQHEGVWLHVVTEAQTLVYHMADLSKTILDQQGLHCGSCAVVRDGVLLVARDDALYEYTTDTRAGCTAFDGIKQGLGLLKRYLYVATDDTSLDGAASSQLHIVDVRNKLVAGSFPVQGLQAVVVGPGGLAAVGAGGKLMRYYEVELNTQLEVLFKRSLHKLALDLAICCDASPELIAAIRQRWGDHLYAKAEYEAAMGQYLETIGHLEPSYVIRRFLDAQRIHSLTRYLEELHARGLAGADHTTLLLNCYTKLKDVAKLDAFIHRDSNSNSSRKGHTRSGSTGAAGMAVLYAAANAARRQGGPAAEPSGEPTPKFDMETAFKVLRSAGYAAHALSVAERAGQPEWMLDVLLEDMASYVEALAFIGMLSRPQKACALQRYGKLLIPAAPDDTTALLMDLCMPPPPDASASADSDDSYVASVADFAHLYTDRPTRLLYLCEYILFNSSGSPPNEQLLYHTLLELYLAEKLVDDEQEQGGATQVAPQARRDKARDLLQRGWQPHMAQPIYDPEHALVLCRQHNYTPGLVLLYDKKRLHKEVLAVHMAAQDYEGLIAACIQYGDAASGGEPQLWADALEYLCKQPGDCSEPVSQVLQHIEAKRVLPPLVVLQTLATNNQLKVSRSQARSRRPNGRFGRPLSRFVIRQALVV